MSILKYIRQRRRSLLLLLLCSMVFVATFALYRLPVLAALYPAGLCLLILIGFGIVDYIRLRRKHLTLLALRQLPTVLTERLPMSESAVETEYQQLLTLLHEEQRRLTGIQHRRYQDMIDYYTIWPHQIKTPIAAMRLHLQNEDSPLSRTLSLELTRIEQYVEMILACLRLGSDSTDYVFRECDLDSIIRPAIRRFSGEFISRRLKLDYQPVEMKVVTDEKWLGFVLEQVLSNALKYTREGGISIYKEGETTLCIRDTGVGIAAEDLPRIFEKGYTGMNGRADQKASGLGLHLCKRICSNLGHRISVRSVVNEGTTVSIDLSQKRLEAE